jgi:hypothetical protein
MQPELPPASEWEAEQVIVLDWYDGPRSGVCRLEHPAIQVSFDLLDERPTDDDLDDRLYYLRSLPGRSVEQLAAALTACCGAVQIPIWVPQWPTKPSDRASLDQLVDDLLSRGQDMDVVVLSRDFQTFQGIWIAQKRDAATDWFQHLGV